MNQTLELMLADGRELDIPPHSLVLIEEMKKGANPNFPEARTYVHYSIGTALRTALLKTKIEDLIFELDINTTNNRWLKLTKCTDERMLVLAHTIVSRMATENGCQIDVQVGRDPSTYEVKESRREIKKWTDRALSPPGANASPDEKELTDG